jgi:hippurate hydrolase
VEFERGFPVTICDGRVVDLGAAAVADLFGEAAWLPMAQPLMGAEDFAYVLQKVPGAMFFLGASHEGSDWRSCCPVHSNRMVLDDSVMARGAALHAAVAERFLERGWG